MAIAFRYAAMLVCVTVSVPAKSSETSTFTYDALGRLVAVVNSGGPRNGNTASNRYDPAGNRSAVAVDQPLPAETTSVVFSLAGPGTIAKGSAANFVISKSGTAASSVSLTFTTADGSATTPTHYTGAAGTLVFRPWETAKTVGIAVLDDGVSSPTRQFSMSISSPSAGGAISASAATATIAGTVGSAPIAAEDFVTIGVCSGKTVNVIANDTDPSGGYPLTVIAVGTGQYGEASKSGSTSIRYVAFGGTGRDGITYTVQNTAGKTATGTLEVTIVDSGGCAMPVKDDQ